MEALFGTSGPDVEFWVKRCGQHLAERDALLEALKRCVRYGDLIEPLKSEALAAIAKADGKT